MRESDISPQLLGWYDRVARVLPWRVGPQDRMRGVRPDPYQVWLSEIMLQQTTVAAVEGYFRKFTEKWPGLADLAAAEDAEVMGDWAGLGYYARARNLLKCARVVVADHGGQFPDDEAALLRLPGIGPYTAAAIAAIAFDRPAVVMDGNIERVMARLFAEQDPLPGVKPRLKAHAGRLTPDLRAGDHAQALMDLGATICTPRKPRCTVCPLQAACQGHGSGIAETLPRKMPKQAKPVRRGIAYVLRRADGAILLETRPEQGLLGGMLGFPTSDWGADPAPAPPTQADWRVLPGEVRHTFTHFHLRLAVHVADLPQGAAPDRGQFVLRAQFRPAQLPTVMRKVHDLASRGGFTD